MKRYTKNQILSAVSIIDIAKDSSIELEAISSGNFTHRCKCPSKDHKSGSERTGSLYIDGDNNNFYCFGCGASNNAIDFYMIANDVSFSEAIIEMSSMVDPDKVTSEKPNIKATNFSVLLSISEYFRSAIKSNPEKMVQIEEVMIKTDQYLDEIDRYDIKKAKALARRVKSTLNRRLK